MGERPFAVAHVFRLADRPGMIFVTATCPPRSARPIRVGRWPEFRNPQGTPPARSYRESSSPAGTLTTDRADGYPTLPRQDRRRR
jgi:hypothetical protein